MNSSCLSNVAFINKCCSSRAYDNFGSTWTTKGHNTRTAVEGILRFLRHHYAENYQDIPFPETSRKLNACARRCVPDVPPGPSSKLELERLGTRLICTVKPRYNGHSIKQLPYYYSHLVKSQVMWFWYFCAAVKQPTLDNSQNWLTHA